jgi:hypothetical protein
MRLRVNGRFSTVVQVAGSNLFMAGQPGDILEVDEPVGRALLADLGAAVEPVPDEAPPVEEPEPAAAEPEPVAPERPVKTAKVPKAVAPAGRTRQVVKPKAKASKGR